MRMIITSATVIDGTGAAPVADSAIVIEDHCIVDVLSRPAATYDRSDVVVDAGGAIVIPGIINHHAHGLTRGPLMITGEPPLTDDRVAYNLRRQLAGGTTTALNVDGFPSVEDAVAVNKLQPLTVKVSSLHTSRHLSWAENGPFPMGGIAKQHRSTVEEMVAAGAVAVGEAGPGIDGHWADHTLIPLAIREELGRTLDAVEARRLRLATDNHDRDALDAAFRELLGVDHSFLGRWRAIYDKVQEWGRLASEALDEAIETAARLKLPMVFHHTPTTFPRLLDTADRLGDRLIAAHSNFQCTTVDDTLARARALKNKGAYIDVMGGDSFGVRMFHPLPTHAFALIEAGLVDAISTDYCGGYWDSLLRVAVEAWKAGHAPLERVIKMLTSTPAAMVPGLAPRRGAIAAGMVADLVVTAPDDPATVRYIIVSGHLIAAPDASGPPFGPIPATRCC